LYTSLLAGNNIALGNNALYDLQSGSNNIAIGINAGTLVAGLGLLTGTNNIIIGNGAYTSSTNSINEIVIGTSAIGNGSNTVTLGNASITKTILKGQVTIGTTSPIPTAAFQIDSTTQGLLPPRITTTQKNALGTIAGVGGKGLIVFDTDTNKLCCWNGTIWNDLF
jgi:hypothetical protein